MDTHGPTPSPARRALLLTVATVLAVVAALGAPTTADAAPGDEYVALGDSFSAGTGTRAPVDGCYRSPYGYPALVASAHALALDYQACSGASTADVLADQLDTLSPSTATVTMTIGGNDVGFSDVFTECALPGWLSDCDGEIDDARSILTTQLPQRLDQVYGAVRTGAPQASVAIAGYPHLFSGRDCSWLTFFSRREMRELNEGTDELNALIMQRSTAVGFTFVEVRDDFDGHAWCDRGEWINGLSWPFVESYHPNRAGNLGYANAIAPALGLGFRGLTHSWFPRSQLADDSPAPTLAARVSTVLDMELTSRANLRRARAEGVEVRGLRHAVRRLHSSSPRVVRAGLRQLQRLEAAHDKA